VSEPPGALTILIVDNDVGFLWWLGELFTQTGYSAIPALNCNQAIAAIKKFSLKVDLLFVNPILTGVVGFVQSLQGSRRHLRVVLIQEGSPTSSGPASPGFRYDATLTRPSGWEPISREDWLQKLRTLVQQLETAHSG